MGYYFVLAQNALSAIGHLAFGQCEIAFGQCETAFDQRAVHRSMMTQRGLPNL